MINTDALKAVILGMGMAIKAQDIKTARRDKKIVNRLRKRLRPCIMACIDEALNWTDAKCYDFAVVPFDHICYHAEECSPYDFFAGGCPQPLRRIFSSVEGDCDFYYGTIWIYIGNQQYLEMMVESK